MKKAILPLFVAALGLLACAHAPRQPAPAPPAMAALSALEVLSACLPRAMHASAGLPIAGPADAAAQEELRKQEFEDYYEAFLDAKQQGKYVACVERNKNSKQYAGNFEQEYAQAKGWLKQAQDEVEKLEPLFSPDKRIADVSESFSDEGDRAFVRRVTVILKDGTQTSIEKRFAKQPPQ